MVNASGAVSSYSGLYQRLSPKLWKNVISFVSDRDMSHVSGTCRQFHQIIKEMKEKREREREEFVACVESHPILSFVNQNFIPLERRISYKERKSVLNDVLNDSLQLRRITTYHHNPGGGGDYLHASLRNARHGFGLLKIAKRQGFEVVRRNTGNRCCDLLHLANNTNFSLLFLTAVLKDNKQAIKSIRFDVIPREIMDFVAYLRLFEGRVQDFQDMLPHTSLFGIKGGGGMEGAVLGEFLKLSAEKNKLRLFKKLLSLGEYYSFEDVLLDLVLNNRVKAIVILLTYNKNILLNTVLFSRQTRLLIALRIAAACNKEEVLQVIFNVFPGDQIYLETLERVIMVHQNPDLPDLSNLDLEGPHRQIIQAWAKLNNGSAASINLILNEIDKRYPEQPVLPEEEKKAVIPHSEEEQMQEHFPQLQWSPLIDAPSEEQGEWKLLSAGAFVLVAASVVEIALRYFAVGEE